MSNTSKGPADKGSRLCIQKVINSDWKKKLDQEIGLGEITWLSPLREDNYAEYQLKEPYIANQLGIPIESYKFWPSNQPQWDAIGVSGNTVILVEAKAHIDEFKNNSTATSEVSIEKIDSAMFGVFERHFSQGNFDLWKVGYYQMANRLTFLDKMNDILRPQGREAKLVLLSFVNDCSYRKTPLDIWEKKYQSIFQDMTGSSEVPDDVVMVYLDVEDLE